MRSVKNQAWLHTVLAALLSARASAHHSLTTYDKSQRATLEGTIKDFQWSNPHIWIHFIARDVGASRDEEWSIEGPSPNILLGSGWTKASLRPGDAVVMEMHPSKKAGVKSGLLIRVTVNGQEVWKNPFE